MNNLLRNLLPEDTFMRMVEAKDSLMERLGLREQRRPYVEYDYLENREEV